MRRISQLSSISLELQVPFKHQAYESKYYVSTYFYGAPYFLRQFEDQTQGFSADHQFTGLKLLSQPDLMTTRLQGKKKQFWWPSL